MTDTHDTPQNPFENHPTQTLIRHYADRMNATLAAKGENYIADLQEQAAILRELHTAMAAECRPHRAGGHHDTDRLSLALRAQNQFCRTVMVLDHLASKADRKNNSKNELSNPVISE